LNADHVEPRVVTAGDPDVVEVIESKAKLGLDQWVPGRLALPRDAEGLEAVDARRDKVDIGAPARNDRITRDDVMPDTAGREGLDKVFPGLMVSQASRRWRVWMKE
jgi:hypothetical protein